MNIPDILIENIAKLYAAYTVVGIQTLHAVVPNKYQITEKKLAAGGGGEGEGRGREGAKESERLKILGVVAENENF